MNDTYMQMYSLGSSNNVYSTALPDGTYIPNYISSYDPRADEFLTQFNRVRGNNSWKNCSFLDLASSEGSTTLGIGQMGSKVYGVEGRSEGVRRANLIRDLVGFSNVTYDIGNVMDPKIYTKVNGIFASGILYHLEDPIEFLELCAKNASDFIYIDSHRMPRDDEDVSKTPFANSLSDKHVIKAHGSNIGGIKFGEADSKDEIQGKILRRPRTGIGNTYSVWLSFDDMIDLMAKLGFPFHLIVDERSNFLRSRIAFFRQDPSETKKVSPYTQPLPERKPALEAMQSAQDRDLEYIKIKNLAVTVVGIDPYNQSIRERLIADNIVVEKVITLPGPDGKTVPLEQLIKLLEGVSGFVILASINPHQIYQQLILFPKIDYVSTSFGMVIKESG